MITKMDEKRESLASRLEELKGACKKAGVKITHQRLVVFQTIAQSTQHPDVETVYEAVRSQIPTISLDTVYRTLWLLRDLGVVSTLAPPHDKVRFDANTARHHHFLCAKCGLASDFYSPELDELPIPDDVEAIGSIESTHVEARGLCTDCLKLGRDKCAGDKQGEQK